MGSTRSLESRSRMTDPTRPDGESEHRNPCAGPGCTGFGCLGGALGRNEMLCEEHAAVILDYEMFREVVHGTPIKPESGPAMREDERKTS